MNVGDRASGLSAIVLGVAVMLYARTFPPMPGQPVGPGLFPAVVGAALAAGGASLVLHAMRREDAAWLTVPEWARRSRMLSNFTLVLLDLVFYAFAVDRLGFFVTAVVFLTVLFALFGVTRRRILPMAAAVTLAMHYGFYTLLRVPLPWGVFEAIAW